MKKRKSPIMLVSVLIIAIIAIVLVNLSGGAAAADARKGPPPDAELVKQGGDEAPRKSMLSQMGDGEYTADKVMDKRQSQGKPIIQLTPATVKKPQPDPNSVNGQWYTEPAKK